MRHGADALAAPPRRLLVRRHAHFRADDLPGDVGGVPVARLDPVMVVARRHEDDRLAVRRLEHSHDVRGDQRPPGQHAQVDGLQVGEERVVALDRQDRLVGLDGVSVVKGVDGERVPVV